MDSFINILISGMAVAYIIELLVSLTGSVLSPKFLKISLTLPLNVVSCYLLGVTGWSLIIFGLAASCIALIVVFFVNRPTSNQVITTRR